FLHDRMARSSASALQHTIRRASRSRRSVHGARRVELQRLENLEQDDCLIVRGIHCACARICRDQSLSQRNRHPGNLSKTALARGGSSVDSVSLYLWRAVANRVQRFFSERPL